LMKGKRPTLLPSPSPSLSLPPGCHEVSYFPSLHPPATWTEPSETEQNKSFLP
jgi:hypothetical protein